MPHHYFFWCEYCREEVKFYGKATAIVQAQALHLFEEHGIDIHDEVAPPPPLREEVALNEDPR